MTLRHVAGAPGRDTGENRVLTRSVLGVLLSLGAALTGCRLIQTESIVSGREAPPGVVRLASLGAVPPGLDESTPDPAAAVEDPGSAPAGETFSGAPAGSLLDGFAPPSAADCCTGSEVCDPTCPFTFRDDLHGFVPMLKHDARAMVNWNNGLLFGAALAGSLAMRDDLDDEVRREVARHPERWGTASNVLGRLGEVQYQVPVLLAVYGYSLRHQDAELHDLSASLISAYTLTGLSTTIIKGVSDTDRPSAQWNNGHYGFPSFHAASSMSIAAVLDEYYGPHVGLPALTLAGLIGWSRIDEEDHDLSDVVFGAALGYLIGKSVASQHRTGDSRVRVLPWTHPTEGATGVQMHVEW